MATDTKVVYRGNGVGFLGLLALVFIALKLSNHIDWGWEWVLAPLWIPFSVVLALFMLAGVLFAAAGLCEWWWGKERKHGN